MTQQAVRPAGPGGARPAAVVADATGPPPGTDVGHGLRVLVVQNEARAADGLVQDLRRHGYVARSVGTAAQALQTHGSADLLLLDPDLPDLDGLELCRRIRAVDDVPIITVTTRGAELDRVLGLQAGSDDYVVRPVGLRELLARMDAVMRRVRPRRPARVLSVGALRVDAAAREARLGGRRLDLTPKEFDLLYTLATRPGVVFSRGELMKQVWGDDGPHRSRTLDTHVSSLRAKLGAAVWIATERGVGFRLERP